MRVFSKEIEDISSDAFSDLVDSKTKFLEGNTWYLTDERKFPLTDKGFPAKWKNRVNHTYKELEVLFNGKCFGKVLQEGDLVLDFDHVYENPEKLNKLNLFLNELKNRNIALYSEKSLSGKGNHTIVWCSNIDKNDIINDRGNIEMLVKDRFSTYTGNMICYNDGRFTTSKEIREIIEEIFDIKKTSTYTHRIHKSTNIMPVVDLPQNIIDYWNYCREFSNEINNLYGGLAVENNFIDKPDSFIETRSNNRNAYNRFQLLQALESDIKEGQRNKYLYLITTWFYRAGFDKELCEQLIEFKNHSLSVPQSEKEIMSMINSTYNNPPKFFNIFPFPELWRKSYLRNFKYSKYKDNNGNYMKSWKTYINTKWGEFNSINDPTQFLLWNFEIPMIKTKTKLIVEEIQNFIGKEINTTYISKCINKRTKEYKYQYIHMGNETYQVYNPRFCTPKEVNRILTELNFKKTNKKTGNLTWFKIDSKNFEKVSLFLRYNISYSFFNIYNSFIILLSFIIPQTNLKEQIEAFKAKTPLLEKFISIKSNNSIMRSIEKNVYTEGSHPVFGVYAEELLKSRYCYNNESVAEIPGRIAKSIMKVEKDYYIYKNMISNLEFLPNSPTIMNAGTSIGQLSACYVFDIEDDIEDIYNKVKYSAIVHKSGGGTGFSFSHLRPENDRVGSTNGVASGPVSFMQLFDTSTAVIKQGGKRRGANLGELHINHPDIEKFIFCKSDGRSFSNFNLSVGYFDDFMKALQSDKDYPLINPRTGEEVKSINANKLFDEVVYNVWLTGDPGCLFLDTINKFNPVKDEYIESTNPCGEVPLPPYGCCNLGSINLNRIVKDDDIDWEHFSYLIRNGVRFLDGVIDANKYPLSQIDMTAKRTRRIGLGFMGLADLFVRLDIPYNSQEAFELAERLSKFMYDEARDESHQLALEYGDFPAIDNSIFKGTNMRNATVLSIAPTGSIGMIANASNGCEPLFYAGYKKTTYLGDEIIITEGVIDYLKRHNLYSQEILNNISNYADDVIVTAQQINWRDHIKMQSTIQKYVDNSVSKTINMPNTATVQDMKEAYIMAWKMGCRGITVFRDGSKTGVVQKCDGESCTL